MTQGKKKLSLVCILEQICLILYLIQLNTMSKIHLLIVLLFLVSCKNQVNNPRTIKTENWDSVKAALDAKHNAEMKEWNEKQAKQPKFVSVFPLGTFKSYPQIVKSVFGNGSNKQEVTRVMGRPELIETTKHGYETWYYGTIEISFKYGLVNEILNAQDCKKYVSVNDLLISKDPIEKKFGQFLLDRLATIRKYE